MLIKIYLTKAHNPENILKFERECQTKKKDELHEKTEAFA
jgi:hypothetical protein